MNSDFNLNSYRNCTSEFFHLVPPKLVTFGGGSINKINSGISDNSSNKQDIIFFRQIPSNQSKKFESDSIKNLPSNKKINISPKTNILYKQSEKQEISDKQKMQLYFNRSFQIGSKTILNTINTCLLNLFSPTNDNDINDNNDENQDIKEKASPNIKYCNSINEEKIPNQYDNNDINNNKKSNSFLEKIKLSPVKKISINNPDNKYENITNKNNENYIDIRNANNLETRQIINPSCNKFFVQGAFKSLNDNNENPAKIHSQFGNPQSIPVSQNYISNNIQNITQISNITNVTNNYYFQYNKPPDFLKKKKDRMHNEDNGIILDSLSLKKMKDNNNKISKKGNLLYGLYQLNQIAVNGVSISKFPVVSMNEDDLEVHLLSKMLNETDYFTIVDKFFLNIPVLDEEKYNKPSYDKIFKKEKEKINNLYLIEENINENNPVNLIRNYYSQIKNKILNIQKNYLSNNKKALSSNVELCAELEKLINSCNAITNTVTDYKKSGLKRKLFLELNDDNEKDTENNNNINEAKNKTEINVQNNNNIKLFENKNTIDNSNSNNNNGNNILFNNKKRKQKKKHFKTYLCEFCNKAYSNGQGLGGHMSRIHPNQSYKYKDKIRIRREREKKRAKLVDIKRDLFKKYGYDFEQLVNDKNKAFIQQFLHEHNEEYRTIRKYQQRETKNNENISENEEEKKMKNIFATPLPKMSSILNNKIDCKNSNNNFSKEKTNDKTEFKVYEEKKLESNVDKGKNEIGIIAKRKVNFESNNS